MSKYQLHKVSSLKYPPAYQIAFIKYTERRFLSHNKVSNVYSGAGNRPILTINWHTTTKTEQEDDILPVP
jgi:hypothetical protein